MTGPALNPAGEGWAFFDAPDPAGEAPEDLDRRIARLFGTPDGTAVLAWLRGATIEQPAWVPGQDPAHGYAREGQDSLVREIERRIRRGLSARPQTPEP